MSKASAPVGRCPCPVKGCEVIADVKKFECRASSDAQRRHAGKLYLVCSRHGRIGVDGRADMQDYILNHEEAEIWGDEKPVSAANEPETSPKAATATQPAASPKAPVPAPKQAPETPAARRSSGLLIE